MFSSLKHKECAQGIELHRFMTRDSDRRIVLAPETFTAPGREQISAVSIPSRDLS